MRAGRDEKEVLLIAVSKTRTFDEIDEAAKAGARVFGENKPQELREKADTLNKDYEWHMIGHLQTNKIKYIVERASLIHSVDSYRLAEAVNKEAEKRNMTANILVQVNIADEDIIEALMMAHNIRPERYTILGDNGISKEAAYELAYKTEVI